ncbi:MAG: rod shape-determining protein MreC, partial [Rhodanobacteraceae bacterium]
RFPAGFPVGEILSISTDASSLFAAAQARPLAALDRSGDVLLLRDQPQPYGAPAPVEEVGPPRDLAGAYSADPKPVAPVKALEPAR